MRFRPGRRRLLKAAAAATIALPMVNFGRYQVFAATSLKYSARAIKLIERSLVIDMLVPLKLDFRPAPYAEPMFEQQVAMFRDSGITAFHHAIGVGGVRAYEDALTFMAGWQKNLLQLKKIFSRDDN